MKYALSLLLALLLLSAAASAQLPPSLTAPPAAKDPAAAATELIDRLAKGDFQAAASNFAGVMRNMAPPEKLSEIWTSLQAQMGPYERRTGVRTQKQEPYEMVLVSTEFQRSTVDFKVLIDGEGKIAGFFIAGAKARPGTGPEYTPPAYVHKDAFQEREVTVGTGEWALPGTLSVPVGAGPFPALVLVHGSGPNDRDETVGKAMPFRDLAR